MYKNIKIFQIYFKPELAQHCDPAFTPLSNVENPHPELREWDVWNRYHESILEQNLDYWGFVSWKFKEKTNLTGQQVFEWINDNPGHDVYLLNPCIINEAVFLNSWEQGDLYHPNISAIGQKFINKLGYQEQDIRAVILDRNRTVFANYVVGNRDFWVRFMDFSRKLFSVAETDPVFKEEVFGLGRSNYAHDNTLPNFTFLIERLIPTFLELENFNSIGFNYNAKALTHDKYHPYLADLRVLSDLKVLVNRHNSDEIYEIWNYLRQKFLKENPNILGLE